MEPGGKYDLYSVIGVGIRHEIKCHSHCKNLMPVDELAETVQVGNVK